MRPILVGWAMILLLHGCGGTSGGSALVSGTVAEAKTGRPVGGLLMELFLSDPRPGDRWYAHTTTAADGSYCLTVPPTQTGRPYRLVITDLANREMMTQPQEAGLKRGESRERDLVWAPRPRAAVPGG